MSRFEALAVLLALTAAAGAEEAGRTVKGEITGVALLDRPPRLTVRLDDGAEVEATLGDRTHVTFKRGTWPHESPPHVSDLQRGMTVRFKWSPDRVDRILVLAVPPGARPGGGYDAVAPPSWGGARPAPAYEAGRELRGRVLEANVAAGTLTAEVDGRPRSFVADPRDLRPLRRGERVVLLTGEDGRLAAVRPEQPDEP
jgi:hypothetical protein